ncbi:dynamin, putative [Talaromyces stipitatus ATCC 10500]|uniref:Dynamin, putative n=1 Tax=Talaromyces stipitatus (strain ATCC 10500 / CBS 375.48 / QM 6759 / NRRL 1006) TaxID=441959 RepID=B8MCA9_TALSN|nr:dynamin, putative [Talaromyces stipitatus ATCC 10500]EED18554.1 dynamin, putative [Talaromyces stipitatus ATCC 10500]
MDGLKIEPLQSLQSKDQAALLDTVDELRSHGVNRYVSLPQLIVCGDQSSGKSSVLEAISGVHFPVNDGLCTRFTTEVILRRATNNLATVKLIAPQDASRSHKEKLFQFQKSSINHAEIPNLISEAKSFMGLTGGSSFSRDVLQLEVSGPKLPHLTLVDLPGLIHHPNKEQTEDDVRIPRELVKKYMSQERSIVLAIVTAKNDTSNQVVLEMAKAADPQGNRTIGIITKPDSLIRDSPNESNFFALASNKETYFKLDWHVLRNGDFNERKDSTFDRDAVEKEFFLSTIWKNLPSHKRGVEALRTRLSHVLYQQIQKELPSLLKEIELELTACKTTMDRLGSPRDTPNSRRNYLSDMANRFNDMVRAGVNGFYQDPFFRSGNTGILGGPETQKTRLRANVRKAEQGFLDKMYQYGHSYVIVPQGSNPVIHPEYKAYQVVVNEQSFLREIRDHLNDSKGRELPGTFSPLLVGELFIRQSTNWKPFAIEFVESVWDIVKQFLDDVLAYVADESVREALLDEVIDPAMDAILENLKEKVTELHSPYARGYPATLNPRFVKELQNRRSQQAENPPAVTESFSPKPDADDADTHACRELLHLMQAYYTVALDVFVDNVSSLAVENCLMSALEGLLCVSQMEDEVIENIVFESQEVRELRSQTLEKQSSLEKSFAICRRQARKLASNRLNDDARNEAQKTESVLASITNGVAGVKVSEPTATTPMKSEVINPAKSQQPRQTPWGQSGVFGTGGQAAANTLGSSLFSTPTPTTPQTTPAPSLFPTKTSSSSFFATPISGPFSSSQGFGSPEGRANQSSNGSPAFGKNPTPFSDSSGSQLGPKPVGSTPPPQPSTLFQAAPAQPNAPKKGKAIQLFHVP